MLPLTVDGPWYLGLLALLPLLWFFSRQSLAALGRWRRRTALLLRGAVLALLVLAIAEMQWVRSSDRLTVVYLVDQSLSVPLEGRSTVVERVNETSRRQRQGHDRVGVIVFGREALIEIPPLDESVQVPRTVESQVDPGHTNLADAIKLAQASFPDDSARRIVIISDGNENLGSAREQAELAAAAGIGIDVYPIRRPASAEVAVEKLALPSEIRRGQPFDLRVALSASLPAEVGAAERGTAERGAAERGAAQPRVIGGRLIVSERTDDRLVVLSDQHIDLPPGKRVFTLRQQIDRPSFYSYEARFVPDDAADDTFAQNNRATAFTHVRGKGQVLLIEDEEHRGEHDLLVDHLGKDNLEVTVWSSTQLFTGLPELQRFDTVILANVARDHFSDEQIAMLASNTQNLGCGLVMLGGPSSFGAGGWANTEVEKAMPIDFSVKNFKVVPIGALALVIDHSGSMSGEKLEMSKAAAVAAVKVLGPMDWIGVVAFDSAAHWIVPMQKVGKPDRIVGAIRRLGIGGGTNMQPGMEEGYRAIRSADAAVKHVVVLTDGHTTGGQYEAMAASMLRQGITTTCVALGRDSAVPLLKNVADAGGGKFYLVNEPRAIPRIFMKEAMRVARPLIYEDDQGFTPKLKYTHEITGGIRGPLPPLTGFVLSTVKHNPLVEVSVLSPTPDIEENATILASWTYGLGKAVAFTSDTGARWAKAWTGWADYHKLFSQMTRWSMRPTEDEGRFVVSTDVADGKAQVFVTALDKNNEFLNFLQLGGTVVGPGAARQMLPLEQTAPGKYAGTFDASEAGTYLMAIGGSHGHAPTIHGINVPYSAEFRDTDANEGLLAGLAARVPRGGSPGVLVREAQAGDSPLAILQANSFRHDLPKAQTMLDTWPKLLWLAGCLFFVDLFVRRVTIDLSWVSTFVARMRDRVLRRETPAPSEYLERLRGRKAEVAHALDEQRAGIHFDVQQAMSGPSGSGSAAIDLEDVLESAAHDARRTTPPVAPLNPEKQVEEETYTSRLLKAKQRVWKDRQGETDG